MIGFGDLDFAADTTPPLTTVRIDAAAIGQTAADLLVERAQAADRVAGRRHRLLDRRARQRLIRVRPQNLRLQIQHDSATIERSLVALPVNLLNRSETPR